MTTPNPAFVMEPYTPRVLPAVVAGPVPTPVMRLDEKVERYRDLRDQKSKMTAQHKQEIAPISSEMDKIETELLDYFNSTGQKSTKTTAGTAYTSSRTYYSIDDPSALEQWVASNGRPPFLASKVDKDAVEEYLKAGNPLPPGIKVSSDITVNVRK